MTIAFHMDLMLLGLDIPTAFLYSELVGPAQIVSLPRSSCDVWGNKVFMKLQKSLFGLRKAPVSWFRTLRKFLIENLHFQTTAESSVYRLSGATGEMVALILVYVDDILIAATKTSAHWIADQIQKRLQVKLTGEIEKTGQLEFLGRQVVRLHPTGPFQLHLPLSYWEQLECALGQPVKETSSPPDLKKFEMKDDASLSATDTEVYRSALGKLAWYSLTMPILAFQVSWLASFQQTPTVTSMRALVAVIRYAKSYRFYTQSLPSQGGGEWCSEDRSLTVLTDASWTLRSVAGGFVLWRGSLIRSWSRRIPVLLHVPCMSSAEAELMGMAEAVKEGMGLSMVAESFSEGLPDKLSTGEHERLTSTFHIYMYTDSESGKHITNMAGLQRRMKHLELRALLLQYLTESGRLTVLFVEGELNPADPLTKPGDVHHVKLYLDAAGLAQIEGADGLKVFLDEKLSVTGSISSRRMAKIKNAEEHEFAKTLDLDLKRRERKPKPEHVGETIHLLSDKLCVVVSHERPRFFLFVPDEDLLERCGLRRSDFTGERWTQGETVKGCFERRDNFLVAENPCLDLEVSWKGYTWLQLVAKETPRRLLVDPGVVSFEHEGVHVFRTLPRTWESFLKRRENLQVWRETTS